MSIYTTQVRYICESYGEPKDGGYESYDDVCSLIDSVSNKIFSQYPIYKEEHRQELNRKILLHYYNMEIGYETVGLWKLKLNARMNEIMPYYNKMYESAELEFNPLENFKYTRNENIKTQGVGDSSGNSKSGGVTMTKQNTTSTSEQTDYRLYSDTPTDGLKGLDGTSKPEGTEGEGYYYLTNATKNKGSGSATQGVMGDASSQGNSEYSDHNTRADNSERLEDVSGKQGTDSYSKMLMEYRDTIINIDMMIIEKLDSLFLGLWN